MVTHRGPNGPSARWSVEPSMVWGGGSHATQPMSKTARTVRMLFIIYLQLGNRFIWKSLPIVLLYIEKVNECIVLYQAVGISTKDYTCDQTNHQIMIIGLMSPLILRGKTSSEQGYSLCFNTLLSLFYEPFMPMQPSFVTEYKCGMFRSQV